jgi:polysulfide reductase chain C
MDSHVWGLPVALDLFFAGLGAGLFLVAMMADLFASDRFSGIRRVGGVLAPWPVLLGVFLLVVDLGAPLNFWEFVLRHDLSFPFLNYLPSSVMSTGTWLLVIFSIVSLCYFVLSLVRWPFKGDDFLRRAIGIVGIPFGLLVTIYTGVLIGGTAIPMWNTPMLPVLFVSSAILAGLAVIIFFLGLRPLFGMIPTDAGVIKTLLTALAALSTFVLVLSLAYVGVIAGVRGGEAQVASILWWVFVIVLGLVVPTVYGLIGSKVKMPVVMPAVAFLAALGGFFLRYTILMNGQL